MSKAAYLPIVGDRYAPLVRHVFIEGLDLTGITMRAQVRLCGDTPGVPLVDLLTVTNGNAEGLRLVEVTTDGNGLPTSHVEIVINETTMEGLPYVGELGDAAQFAWDWQIVLNNRKRRLARGEFEITGDGVTGAEVAPANRPIGSGRPRLPIADVWSAVRLTLGEEQVTIQIVDAALVAPMAKKAADAAVSADASRSAAQLAAATAQATSRYFATKAAGEAASTINQLFATDDGAGNLIYYRRTASGSIEVGRAVTPSSIANAFTNGGRRSLTSAGAPLTEPGALFHIVNADAVTCGLRVTSYWAGSAAAPYQNNDNSLWETFNRTLSNSTNYSWSGSYPNAYNDIPAGVRDGGERVGLYGWTASVSGGAYVHAGTLASQIGVRGRAGFQENGSPATAVVENSVGVQGEIVAESPGATIQNATAGRFVSEGGAGKILRNIAAYASAQGGTEFNYSFYGNLGVFYNYDRAIFGPSLTASQSQALVSVRGVGGVEFGNPDPNGYGSNFGATASSGYPFVGFSCEADPTGDTFRTRGKRGTVMMGGLDGVMLFGRLTNANAPGQAVIENARFTPEGHLQLAETPILRSRTPATATAAGQQGEFCWDDGFLYVCVAKDTWKRTALAGW